MRRHTQALLLIVETVQDLAESIADLFQQEGFAVKVFVDAASALSWLQFGERVSAALICSEFLRNDAGRRLFDLLEDASVARVVVGHEPPMVPSARFSYYNAHQLYEAVQAVLQPHPSWA